VVRFGFWEPACSLRTKIDPSITMCDAASLVPTSAVYAVLLAVCVFVVASVLAVREVRARDTRGIPLFNSACPRTTQRSDPGTWSKWFWPSMQAVLSVFDTVVDFGFVISVSSDGASYPVFVLSVICMVSARLILSLPAESVMCAQVASAAVGLALTLMFFKPFMMQRRADDPQGLESKLQFSSIAALISILNVESLNLYCALFEVPRKTSCPNVFRVCKLKS
jgi:hypothetical protein